MSKKKGSFFNKIILLTFVIAFLSVTLIVLALTLPPRSETLRKQDLLSIPVETPNTLT